MAQTKVKLISDGVIVQSNLHASHGITTAHIGEGSNLYYTDARSRAAISVSGNALSYNSSTGVITSNFEESPTFTGDITMSKSTSGGLYIKTTSNAEPFIAIQRNSGSNGVAVLRGIDGGHLYIDTGATGAGQSTKMVVQAGGHVGIANTNPLFELCIGAAGTPNRNMLEIAVNSSDTGTNIIQNYNRATGAYTPLNIAGSLMTFGVGTAATERMRITSTGNVGIGTTSPTAKLEIVGSNGTNIFRGNFAGSADIFMGFDNANPYLMLQDNSNVTTHLFQSNVNNYIVGSNVGIGTTSPQRPLHINGTEGVTRFTSTASGNDGFEVGIGTSSQAFLWQSENSYMQFATNNTEKMRIDSSGRVGINVTPTYSNVPLHTKKLGGSDAYNIFEGDSAWVFGEVDYSGTKVCQVAGRYGHHSGININTSGNVGIGTSSPDYKLHIERGGDVMMQLKATDSNQAYMKFVNSTTGDGKFTDGLLFGLDNDESGVFWNYEATPLRFATSGSEKMRITSAGNVGIGFSYPDGYANLTVSGTSSLPILGLRSSSGKVRLGFYESGTGRFYLDSLNGSDGLAFIDGDGSTERMRIASNGVVTFTSGTAIGVEFKTTDTSYGAMNVYKDHTGTTRGAAGYNASAMYFGGEANTNTILQAGGQVGLYINNSTRNVGIGTTSPSAVLHVVGKVNTNRIVSSNLIMGNIRSNLTTTSYLLLVDLNVSAGYSMVGELNAASYTTYNVSRIYVRKNYNATTGVAVITGIAKSGSNLSVVDISHSSGRFIALKLTGDPEIDVMWTGYRLDTQFNSDGTIKTLTSGVTENSVYASY